MVNLGSILIVGAALFAIGAWGVVARRNLLIVFMSIEVMLNAVNLVLVGFARWLGGFDGYRGQVFVLMIMAVAAAEAAVGLALILALFRTKPSIDADEMASMKN